MEQMNLSQEEIRALFISLLIFITMTVAIIYISIRFLRFLEIKLKVMRIRKIAKKTSLDGYAIKTNEKGVPVLLINKDNPVEIFVL